MKGNHSIQILNVIEGEIKSFEVVQTFEMIQFDYLRRLKMGKWVIYGINLFMRKYKEKELRREEERQRERGGGDNTI